MAVEIIHSSLLVDKNRRFQYWQPMFSCLLSISPFHSFFQGISEVLLANSNHRQSKLTMQHVPGSNMPPFSFSLIRSLPFLYVRRHDDFGERHFYEPFLRTVEVNVYLSSYLPFLQSVRNCMGAPEDTTRELLDLEKLKAKEVCFGKKLSAQIPR